MEHRFGGPWTDDKLRRIDKYLGAYMTIFTRNPRASLLKTNYVDAFAGTGRRTSAAAPDRPEGALFEDALQDADAGRLKEGSAYVALRQERPFDRYVFVDRSAEHARGLEGLRGEFPHLSERIAVEVADANVFLADWCRETDWRENRAVVFLDAYGMQVHWATIEALAATKAIDLWLLFPLGQAINRLLTRGRLPTGAHAESLTRSLGTDGWREAFYAQEQPQASIFDELDNGGGGAVKLANFDSIGAFFVGRLKTVFEGVAENPLPLRNSREVPLYLLCFAASNPRGASTAVNIAQHILRGRGAADAVRSRSGTHLEPRLRRRSQGPEGAGLAPTTPRKPRSAQINIRVRGTAPAASKRPPEAEKPRSGAYAHPTLTPRWPLVRRPFFA